MSGQAASAKRVLIASAGSRRWEGALKARLEMSGYEVGVEYTSNAGRSAELDRLLMLERWRRKQPLAARVDPMRATIDHPDIVIDLGEGDGHRRGVPRLTLAFGGEASLERGVAAVFGGAASLELTARLDDVAVGQARPMLDERVWLSGVTDNILAAAISLLVQTVDRHFAGRLVPLATAHARGSTGLAAAYLPALASGLATRFRRRLTKQRPFYWQVAYRSIEGQGIAETGAIDGVPFTVLEDDGERFYADPFVITRDGRHYLFVEEYPYAKARGVISVTEIIDGRAGVPRTVLEEPHHLSYPQVFARDGEVFMLPESGGARELVLYRSMAFPDQWVRDTVLVSGRDLNDATLLERDGRLWLFATERFEGSASDTLVVFSANSLRGPWRAHRDNPIAIDLAGARPGGAFSTSGSGEAVMPVQDGRGGYGNGLGLMRLVQLGDDGVAFDTPRPIEPGAAWPDRRIHTLNRAGRIEVVDSATPVR